MLTETQIGKLEDIVTFLAENQVLRVQRTGFTSMTSAGTHHKCAIVILPNFNVTVNDPNFSPS